MRVLKATCCAAALVVSLAPGVLADEWNKKTYLTFSGPVQIPGTTLPAGTYTFELASPDSTRHVIRVSSQDGTKTYGLFMTIPNERLDAPDENVVMFNERPVGSPKAIQVWFYPGDRVGEEFVYPRKQATSIAKATHKGVLATSDDTLADVSAARRAAVGRVDENGNMKAATSPDPGARTTDRSVGTAGQTRDSDIDNRRAQKQLPRTASNLTSFELLAGLALAGALVARQLRRLESR
jgi:hypothetical protein